VAVLSEEMLMETSFMQYLPVTSQYAF